MNLIFNASKDPNGWIREVEILHLVSVSRSTLGRWVTCGKFPKPRHFGHIKYWLRHEVQAWMDARAKPPG
jgi:predicted DNA-binding transcriptional regulator AlpA